MQVLAAPSTAELRVGDVTLKRERWLVDALQQRLFLRVSALRQLFRVRPDSGPPCRGPVRQLHRMISSHPAPFGMQS